MTSESTRFLGQPSETKPTLGRVEVEVWTGSSVVGGITFDSTFVANGGRQEPEARSGE